MIPEAFEETVPICIKQKLTLERGVHDRQQCEISPILVHSTRRSDKISGREWALDIPLHASTSRILYSNIPFEGTLFLSTIFIDSSTPAAGTLN